MSDPGAPAAGSGDAMSSADRERLGALTAGLVHNLNNMLAPILMSVDLLRSDETDAERMELLDAIDEAATRAARTVREVNELARVGRTGPGQVAVSTLVRDVATLIEDTFPRRIEVVFRPSPHELEVRSDAGALQAFIVDRCLESLDRLDEGGTVTIAVGPVEAGDGAGTGAMVSITDTGPARDRAPLQDPSAIAGLAGAAVAVTDDGRRVELRVPPTPS